MIYYLKMSDEEDWEKEVEDDNEKDKKTETKTIKTKKDEFQDETEEIIEKEHVSQKQPIVPKEQVNYEKKYNEKNKKNIKDKIEIEDAVKNITDEELKLKKKLELEELKRAEKFLGVNDVDDDKLLNVEKDFIDLAKKNVAKINTAKKPLAYTYSYLYNTLELLCPSLQSEQINDLKSLITIIFNKKLKEEGGGKSNKKAKAKPTLNSGKMQKNIEKNGLYDQYGGGEEQNEEEEEENFEDEDDFM